MKVTSFEISKRLSEIGFKADFDFCYHKDNEYSLWNKVHEITCWKDEDLDSYYAAYDLETILQFIYSFRIQLYFEITELGYLEKDNSVKSWIITNKNESLTDAAARLLILLHEKGLV